MMNRGPMGGWGKTALMLCLLGVGGASLAAPEPAALEQAKIHFRSGRAHLAEKEYEAAASEFEAALRTGKEPGVLFWLGEALRLKGDPRRALAAYEAFVARVGDAPPKIMAEAEAHRAELRVALHMEEAPAAGEMSYSAGLTHLDMGEYREALVDLTEGYRLLKQPRILEDIAECHRGLGALDEAAEFHRRFIEESGSPAKRADSKRLSVAVEKPATATIPAPAASRNEATPPAPAIVATPAAPAIVATPAAPAIVATPIAPIAAPASAPPLVEKEAPRRSRAWIVLTVGGAALVVAGAAIGLGVGLSRGSANEQPFIGNLSPGYQSFQP